jgi:ferredoxin
MVATDIYHKLAKHLDQLPAGFPSTESGVEIRILQRLFTRQDANLALHLTLIPEEPRVIARRAEIPLEEVTRQLEEMEKKGLIMGFHREGMPPRYMAQQFVVGFWEGQVNRLDVELVKDVEEYMLTYSNPDLWRKAPQLRTIPVNRSITVQSGAMPYEQAGELVRGQKNFAVSNCICRQERHLLDQGCDRPMESCLTMGIAAETVVRNGRGRAITLEETLQILDRAEKAGLVLQPANAKKPLFICTCCGCCCGVLRGLKLYPKPGRFVSSPYLATLDTETCKGCGACTKRCQMEAVSLHSGKAALDLDRCIGCGLCVTTCPSHSLSLVRKPEVEQPYVPKNFIETVIKLGRARGKMGPVKLLGMQVRSKLDRLLAWR